MDADRHCAVDARLLEMEARLVEVVRLGGEVGIVERVGRRDRLVVADPAVAAEDGLEDGFTIDGVFEGEPQVLVAERLGRGVHRHRVVQPAGRFLDLEARTLAESWTVLRSARLIRSTRFEVRAA